VSINTVAVPPIRNASAKWGDCSQVRRIACRNESRQDSFLAACGVRNVASASKVDSAMMIASPSLRKDRGPSATALPMSMAIAGMTSDMIPE
jgi:hypothetical protein